MESPLYQGAMLIILMVCVAGLWIWAWSHERKATFKKASMLPLEEDNGVIPGLEDEKD